MPTFNHRTDRHGDAMRKCSVDGCERRHKGHGYCNAHYLRLTRNGGPMAGNTGRGAPLAWLDDLIFSDKAECIQWPFSRVRGWKCTVKFNGRTIAAHRLVCMAVNGLPPTSRHQAAHSCGMGHTGCLNPRHLRWATNRENQADRKIHKLVRGPEAVSLVDEKTPPGRSAR